MEGEPFSKVGDMPHNWASAEFIRLAVHLLALDRGDELHLLEGFPREWAGPGMITRLRGVATPFGPLHLTVQADRQGKHATLTVKPLAANCQRSSSTCPMARHADWHPNKVAPSRSRSIKSTPVLWDLQPLAAHARNQARKKNGAAPNPVGKTVASAVSQDAREILTEHDGIPTPFPVPVGFQQRSGWNSLDSGLSWLLS